MTSEHVTRAPVSNEATILVAGETPPDTPLKTTTTTTTPTAAEEKETGEVRNRISLRKNRVKRLAFGIAPPPPPLPRPESERKRAKAEEAEKRKEALLSRRVVVDVGELVWGKLQGFDWWPALVVHDWEAKQEKTPSGHAWIRWLGNEQYSGLACTIDRLARFESFAKKVSMPKLRDLHYRDAIMTALEIAAKRCRKTFSDVDDEPIGTEVEEVAADVLSSQTKSKKTSKKHKPVVLDDPIQQKMLQWAISGFPPTGPGGFQPTRREVTAGAAEVTRIVRPDNEETENDEEEEELMAATLDKRTTEISQEERERFSEVRKGVRKIETLCLSCASLNVDAEHPLFEGGLCNGCKESFQENYYLFDDDGTQMYCAICSDGIEVFLCDITGCSRAFCYFCIEKICGKEELNKISKEANWLCFMCEPEKCPSPLKVRLEWRQRLQELFALPDQMQFDQLVIPAPLPLGERRSLRVLSLFDGIATGYVVLKNLGFDIEKYVAAEIDCDAVRVSYVHHPDIIHLGDVRKISRKKLKELGPFDLLIGGSPCTELSIANPNRKGIYEGSGQLFFEFYRIFEYLKPCVHDPCTVNESCAHSQARPFFWLFENVMSMTTEVRKTISRFFQCSPVVVDAFPVSAANRRRYFWGNMPGMNRPMVPLPGDKVTLQDCLEPNCGRTAQFNKLRTVTTKANSIKQTKQALFPVMEDLGIDDMPPRGDILWCTELERVFGLPDHYTDVANMSKQNRQRLIGQAWSVPVVRHLLSPLRDYYKCVTVAAGAAE
ncbi:DNA (cytosine-5)-methyltransferase 3B-like [Oscarella lobularis]|uniref:DNA (cytosine-5)-methyltransferase 3B-like n=1 Tax=Oscarella lobularis TaxID=121494 RepID=UPI0033142641